MNSLSSNLKRLMKRYAIEDTELSKETGVPAPTINRLKNNAQMNPTLRNLLPIAKYFKVSVEELVGEESGQANSEAKLVSIDNLMHSSWPENFKLKILTEKYSPYIPKNATIFLNKAESFSGGGVYLCFDKTNFTICRCVNVKNKLLFQPMNFLQAQHLHEASSFQCLAFISEVKYEISKVETVPLAESVKINIGEMAWA